MVDPELALFAEHAAWLAPRLADPSRRGVVNWVASYLREGAGSRLARHLAMDHPVQIRGERSLASLLCRRLEASAVQTRVSDRIGRDVDWPLTLQRAVGMVPVDYVSRVRVTIPDRECQAALAGVARSWLQMLETFGESEHHRSRKMVLRRALRAVGLIRAAGYSQRHSRRLRRLDGSAAQQCEDIEEALKFWCRPFGDSDREVFLRAGQLLRSDDAKNVDNLLELTATLSIARAACSSGQYDTGACDNVQCWRLTQVDKDSLVLQRGHLRCTLYKGLPCREREDRLNPTIRLMGLGVRGNQPDINLKFDHAEYEGSIYLMGDAKRNWTGDGERYLRSSIETAATYATSYSHLLGSMLPAAADYPYGFQAKVHPAVTLFCRKGVSRVLGEDQPARIVSRFRTDLTLPPITALDLESHFGPGSGTWSAPVLQAWFARIADDATRALRAGQGC